MAREAKNETEKALAKAAAFPVKLSMRRSVIYPVAGAAVTGMLLCIIWPDGVLRTYRNFVHKEKVNMPVVADKAQTPIIAIYRVTEGVRLVTPDKLEDSYAGVRLILAVWQDGNVLWSDSEGGGPPYYWGHVDKSRIDSFFSDLSACGVFSDCVRFSSYYAIESTYEVIAIEYKGKQVNMESDHESERFYKDTIATAEGLLALEGRSREGVWSGQPDSYKRFRKLWSDIREEANKLVPSEAELTEDVSIEIR